MKRTLQSLFALLFSMAVWSLEAQVVKGTITDKSGEPLPGASVLVVGQSGTGTAADFDGNYSLSGLKAGKLTLEFAFIGFDRGEQPIGPILDLFEKMTIKFEREIKRPKIGNRFRVDLPTAEDIFAITPLPWATGRSWAQGIERGLSGLGYLLRKNKGRSGAAIQSRVKVRAGKFQNSPYISALISKYKKKFEELR